MSAPATTPARERDAAVNSGAAMKKASFIADSRPYDAGGISLSDLSPMAPPPAYGAPPMPQCAGGRIHSGGAETGQNA
ncbi:hypothetical protein JCM4814A_22770 [Streptomyces phaeofaciens JCM 4814]|uniref:Uncharacterized protein n=1 Tax=Streptomyces phaeofaciens TaxID=68254 RepID=A0A918H4G3_9ACTN|nr:hypothetical protein GCM10010226_08120 [Streptomyces phaeofaciens]